MRFDTLHLNAQSGVVGGASRFARFPNGNHPRSACPALLNIECGVMIAMRYKSTIHTSVLSRSEGLAHPMAALRAVLRRVGRIHLDYLTTSFFRFVRQDRDELTPSCVADALGEMMILNHSSHVQIFNGDCVKLLDEIEHRLVIEVRAPAL